MFPFKSKLPLKLPLILQQALDLGLVSLAFSVAYYTKLNLVPLQYRHLALGPNYNLILLLTLVIAYIAFNFFNLYQIKITELFYKIFLRIVAASVATAIGITFIIYILHLEPISRILVGLFVIFLIIFLSCCKAAIFYIQRYNSKRAFSTRKVLIIGTRERALEMIKAIVNNPESGYTLLGCLETTDKQDRVGLKVYRDVEIIGTLGTFPTLLLEKTVDEVIFALPLKIVEDVNMYISFAEELGVNVRIMPDFQIQQIMFQPNTARIYLDQFIGQPTIALSSVSPREGELFVKTLIDYTGAFIGLILLAPLFIIVSILIKVSSPGPVFFVQERCGLNGRKFGLIKFRTMVMDAEKRLAELMAKNEMDGPVFKMKDDPRITPIGRFLRKTSIDELPQLFNVIKGEMSLVGPRPPIPSEVELYKPWQRRRLSMKPGLTCIWQVSGRNNIEFERWMRLDLQYIDNWSLLLDFKLLLLTVKEVFCGDGR